MCVSVPRGRRWSSTAAGSTLSASRGWSRIAGGPSVRCGVATGSSSATRAATSSSSTTCSTVTGTRSAEGRARMAMAGYVELHCHSAYSFLDGASLPDELVAAALELGYEAMALTDHNSVSGSMEFAQAPRAMGLRPTHAPDLDLHNPRPIPLLLPDARR